MRNNIKQINQNIQTFFFKLTKILLQIIAWILGFCSFWFPVIKIWTEIIDKKLTFLNTVLYIFIGILSIYFALAIDKIVKILKEKE